MSLRSKLRLIAVATLGLAPALPATAQGVSGAYLAARHASFFSDFRAASNYYAQALIQDPTNATLMENAIMAYLGLGDVERAVAVARRMISVGGQSQVANMALLAENFQRERFAEVVTDLDAGQSVGPLVDGLLKAWAHLGMGRMSEAQQIFDEAATSAGIEVFGLYHKALALALAGDFEGADEIFSGRAKGTLQLTRRGVLAFVQVLSQLERNADAIELIDTSFRGDLDQALAAVRADLEAGTMLPFTAIRDAKDGAAEVYLVVAGALNGEAADGYTLIYSRLAQYLRPDSTDAILLSAGLLEQLERYELASETYKRVSSDDPAFDAAELGRAETLRKSGKTEAAIEVMEALSRSRPENPAVFITLGDTLRGLERYGEAAGAYDKAIALYPEPGRNQWLVFFARGITHERTDKWDAAEADFRRALELNPGQPQVLNYLGYSYVEMGRNLDEALSMIEEAVASRPDSGYIIDSLGWVLYRTGVFGEAVGHLERATELMPVDPVVNDHLGDAYWAVGRKNEAEFQWKRALSFDPEEKDAERIRRKLEVGLDVVRQEEGAPPIVSSANDG